VVECIVLESPPNGTVILPMPRIVNSEASYACNGGFNLSGDSMRTCQSDRQWSGSEPTCVEGKQLFKNSDVCIWNGM